MGPPVYFFSPFKAATLLQFFFFHLHMRLRTSHPSYRKRMRERRKKIKEEKERFFSFPLKKIVRSTTRHMVRGPVVFFAVFSPSRISDSTADTPCPAGPMGPTPRPIAHLNLWAWEKEKWIKKKKKDKSYSTICLKARWAQFQWASLPVGLNNITY